MSIQKYCWRRKPQDFLDSLINFFETLFSLILLRKINENSVRSKYYLAAQAAKRLFRQPHEFFQNTNFIDLASQNQ